MQASHRTGRSIAIVTGSLSGYAGGAPRSTANHAKALQTQGIDVTIFTGFSRKYPLTPDHFDLGNCEIVPARLLGPSVLGLAVGALWKLWRRAREFDVIHLNGHWNLTTFIGSRIARARRVSYVITTRGHLGRYDFRRYPVLKFFLYRLLERPNIRGATRMHVCSDWELEDSRAALTGARIVKLPNALNLAEVVPPMPRTEARGRLGIAPGDFVVLFLGRIAVEKSPFFLLQAWAKAALPENACLAFVGPCGAGLKRRLQKAAPTGSGAKRIRFVDYVAGEEKRAWLAACDLFVLPSTDDSFSVAVIEASASGAMCLVSPFVGAVEYLPKESVRVLPLEPDAWSRAFRELCAAPPPQKPLPEDSLQQFRLQTVGRQWAELYEQIVNEAQARESK